MKSLLAAVALFSSSDMLSQLNEVWEFKVTQGDLSFCQNTGSEPCFIIGRKPIIFLFRPGSRFLLVESVQESERAAVMVIVLDGALKMAKSGSSPQALCFPRPWPGGTCFEMGEVKRLLLISEGKEMNARPLTVFGAVPAILAKSQGE